MERRQPQEDKTSQQRCVFYNDPEIPVTYHTGKSTSNHMRTQAPTVNRDGSAHNDNNGAMSAPESNGQMVNYCIPRPIANFLNACSGVGAIDKQSSNGNNNVQPCLTGNRAKSLDLYNGQQIPWSSSSIPFARSAEWSRSQPFNLKHMQGQNINTNLNEPSPKDYDLRLLLDAMQNQQTGHIDKDKSHEKERKKDFDQAVLDYIRHNFRNKDKAKLSQTDNKAKGDEERVCDKGTSSPFKNTSQTPNKAEEVKISSASKTKAPKAKLRTETQSSSTNKNSEELSMSPTQVLRQKLLRSLKENTTQKRKRFADDVPIQEAEVKRFGKELPVKPFHHGRINESITSFSKARMLLEKPTETSSKIRFEERQRRITHSYPRKARKTFKRYRDRGPSRATDSESDVPYESKKFRWAYDNERFLSELDGRLYKSSRAWDKHKYDPSKHLSRNYRTDWEDRRSPQAWRRYKKRKYTSCAPVYRCTTSKYPYLYNSYGARNMKRDFDSDPDMCNYSLRPFHRNNGQSSSKNRYYDREDNQGNMSDASTTSLHVHYSAKESSKQQSVSQYFGSRRSNRDLNGYSGERGVQRKTGGIWRTTLKWRNRSGGKRSSETPSTNNVASNRAGNLDAEKVKKQCWDLVDISSQSGSESSNDDSSADDEAKDSWTIRSECSGTDSNADVENSQVLKNQNSANTKNQPAKTKNRITVRSKKRQIQHRERVRSLKTQASKLKKVVRTLKKKVAESEQTSSGEIINICSQCRTLLGTGTAKHGVILTRLGKTATTACCKWAKVELQQKEEMDQFLLRQKHARRNFKNKLRLRRRKLILFEVAESDSHQQSSRWPVFASQIEQRKSEMSFSEAKSAVKKEPTLKVKKERLSSFNLEEGVASSGNNIAYRDIKSDPDM